MSHTGGIFLALAAALPIALAATATTSLAHAAPEAAPMALLGVMQKLGQDMQAVTGAIALEDWARVAELAPGIARHAEPPPEEKARIIGWLGPRAGNFRGYDAQTHEAATVMGEAASRSDGKAVIAAFAQIQQSCLGCHQEFRQPFLEHFYRQH